MRRILGIAILCLSVFAIANGQQPDRPLTNASVIKLVKAGFKEKTIITIIGNKPATVEVAFKLKNVPLP